jgi:hypothetical protein
MVGSAANSMLDEDKIGIEPIGIKHDRTILRHKWI